jgi:hypothetical protein
MTLAELDLPPDILADAKRWMGDMEMSENVFLDYLVEAHGPEDEGQGDYKLYRTAVLWGVEALRDVEGQAEPD